MEDPLFLRLTIAHYRAVLATKLADAARANVQRLLAQAEDDLGRAARGLAPAVLAGRSEAAQRRRAQTSVSE